MDYKEFFTTNNGSGWKTVENKLKNKEPKIYYTLKLFIDSNKLSDLPFKQQVWHFMNNDKERKGCTGCGESVTFKDRLSKGYNEFCSLSCANKNGDLQTRAKSAIKEKFGVDYYTQHDEFYSKVKKTKLDRYGNEKYNNIKKCLETKEFNRGSKTYNNSLKNKLTTRENLLVVLSSKTPDTLIRYDINDSNITFNCSSCGKDYEIYNTLFNYRTSVNVKTCTNCNPINDTNSIQEKELFIFIKELLNDKLVINKDKTILNPLELDIYVPSHDFSIEFNGLYWHSELYVEDLYHLNKTELCRKQGIDLIHIFEDEWMFKKEIVKSILKSKLGVFDKIIYGRKCEIKEVNVTDSRIFLDNNHIQGNVNSKVKIGLYYDNELVSLMTFGGLRVSMGSKSEDGSYEMYRFANKLNTSVIGGFSKLLKYFIKTYNPKSILTFSDNRYFTGEIYKSNNFSFISETKPNYFYIIKHKRENRFKYRKDILVSEGYDKDKSERQIMKERGINRIYDCGNKKWLLKL